MDGAHLKRTIGLPGAVATLVGYVVGASIFILPGQLAASTGPAIFVTYLLASIPALFACFVSAQIGAVLPVSGATYVAVSRFVSPIGGFLVVWSYTAGIVVAVALVAYGFADYLAFFMSVNRRLVALGTVVFFGAINLLGARLSVVAQTVMTVGFMLALLVFGVGGVLNMDPSLLRPVFPNGFGPVVAAAIPAYFSYIGFLVIIEIGEEVKRPARTIPIAIAISFVFVLFFYTVVPVALPGLIPWRELGGLEAPVATAASLFLPRGVAGLISVGALFAAATSLNGILLSQSREVFALARDRVLPAWFGRLHPKFLSPDRAIVSITLLSMVSVLSGATITAFATLAVMAFMVVQVLGAVAVFVLPWRSARRFAQAEFRLSPVWRVFFSVGLMLLSLFFIVVVAVQDLRSVVALVIVTAIGVAYYLARRWVLAGRGVELDEILRREVAIGE